MVIWYSFLTKREVRELCDNRVHFYQSLQESELKSAHPTAKLWVLQWMKCLTITGSLSQHCNPFLYQSHAFSFSMNREQREAVFHYWISAVEVTKWNILTLVNLCLIVTFMDFLLVLWSESFESVSSKPRSLSTGVFGFQRAERTGGQGCFSGCDTRCDGSAVNLNSIWIIPYATTKPLFSAWV